MQWHLVVEVQVAAEHPSPHPTRPNMKEKLWKPSVIKTQKMFRLSSL